MEGEGLKAVFAICYPCQNSRLLDPVVKVRLPARPLPHDVDDPVEHLVLQPGVPLSLRRIKKKSQHWMPYQRGAWPLLCVHLLQAILTGPIIGLSEKELPPSPAQPSPSSSPWPASCPSAHLLTWHFELCRLRSPPNAKAGAFSCLLFTIALRNLGIWTNIQTSSFLLNYFWGLKDLKIVTWISSFLTTQKKLWKQCQFQSILIFYSQYIHYTYSTEHVYTPK